MGIGISRFVDNYKIYIDTCSLLEDGALDFLERSKFTLKYAGKKIYIMQDVLGEHELPTTCSRFQLSLRWGFPSEDFFFALLEW